MEKNSPGKKLKAMYNKTDKSLSFKSFINTLTGDADKKLVSMWKSYKKGANNLKRGEPAIRRIAEQKVASKSGKKDKK